MISMLLQQETMGHAAGARSFGRELSQSLVALGVSALVTACFVGSASETPLPHTFGAAAFLSVAVFTDVRWMKIPNALTFPALSAV